MADFASYPLLFEPIYKQRMWGGDRLRRVLQKSPPAGVTIGEAWELSDHFDDISVVCNGPFANTPLRGILEEFHQLVLGRSPEGPQANRFPLLIKWVDSAQKLSVQVHPPDGYPGLPEGELGKTECWYVLDAAPEAEIYLGLRRGIDRDALVRELRRGTADRCLNAYPVQRGDFFFVPAGTVHAIGEGVLLAEIQQSSDTTYRLFDWNRLDPATGAPRQLHIDAALDSINFATWDLESHHKRCDSGGDQVLVSESDCPYFAVAFRHISSERMLGGQGACHILICLEGEASLRGGAEECRVRTGDTALLPATQPFSCHPEETAQILDVWIP